MNTTRTVVFSRLIDASTGKPIRIVVPNNAEERLRGMRARRAGKNAAQITLRRLAGEVC